MNGLPASRPDRTLRQRAPRRSAAHPAVRFGLLFTLCGVLAGTIDRDAARDAFERGNAAFAAGQFEAALQAYASVGDASEEEFRAELLNNQAAAQFKLGQIDDARELWTRAATLKDAPFEARARYNLGNCDYSDALRLFAALQMPQEGVHVPPDRPQGRGSDQPANGAEAQPQPEEIRALLDRATQNYIDAIRLDPALSDARANLELAQQLRERLEEQASSQPTSQPQPSSQSGSQPSTQPSNATQPSQDQQDQNAQNRSQTQPATQPQPQSQPAPQTQPQPQEPQSQPADAEERPIPPEVKLSPEEAERLLQMVRDMEHARRLERARREAAKYEPVKRDW